MKIVVKLFAGARQAADEDHVVLELPEGAVLADLRQTLLKRHPELSAIVGGALFAVNADYASDQTTVCEQDEIACIPPVSGG